MKVNVASGIIPGLALLCFTAAAGACARNLAGPIERSEWGGDHIGLTVSTNGGALEYDCASGSIDQSIVARNGNFIVQGTHSPGHGGPIREGEIAERHPAQYEGWTDGDTMRLSVTLTDTGQKLGSFTLIRGRSPHVFRCM